MSSSGRIVEITPLLPWRPASLSPSEIFPLLGHVDADQLVHAGRQLVALLAREHADPDHLAALAVGNLERGVAHLAGLLAEDRATGAPRA